MSTEESKIQQLRNDLQDAARYRHLKQQFSPMGLDISGRHAWQWRGNPGRLRGPNLDAAIDDDIRNQESELMAFNAAKSGQLK